MSKKKTVVITRVLNNYYYQYPTKIISKTLKQHYS